MAQQASPIGETGRGSIPAVIALVLVALSLFTFTAKAGAEIVVGQGAAGVNLGDSKQQVLSTLGKPFRSEPTFVIFPKPCLCTVSFKNHKAASIDVLSKSQRTDQGVGPGTSYEKTTAAYPEAHCYHPSIYGETSRLCVLRSEYKGRSVKTVFAFFEQDLGVRDVEIRLG